MTKIYKLNNKIKHYDWGSAQILPGFLGIENSKGLPYAEMWMGTHSGAPSLVELDNKNADLAEISGELSFLFKLLAVEKPLSIQVHPGKIQAQEGFEKENKAGIALDAPERNYKDPNHKSEIICALTPFTLMAGFKKPEDIYASFGTISDEQKKLIKHFETLYPGDGAVYTPLYFNLITLQPGQAIYVPTGIPHAYISGFGLELMISSDNVLRGGLTSKYKDTDELNKIIKKEPFLPEIITPSNQSVFNYPVPDEGFSLNLVRSNGEETVLDVNGSAIGIVTEGESQVDGSLFKKGESFFICKDAEKIKLKGKFSLFIASGKIK